MAFCSRITPPCVCVSTMYPLLSMLALTLGTEAALTAVTKAAGVVPFTVANTGVVNVVLLATEVMM